MEKITYIGLERCDFIFHLANILSLQGPVLVIDRSETLDLMKSVSPYDDLNAQVEVRNIIYVKDVDEYKTDVSNFEYVLIYAGMNFEEKDFYDNTLTLIMPSFKKYELVRIANKLPVNVSNPMHILRDKANSKYSIKSVATLFNIHPKDILGYIPLNQNDQSQYVNLTYNRSSNIKNVSEEMLSGIEFAAAKILNIEGDTKKIKKVLKAAQKLK